jgi:hypothetical protein
MFYGAIQSWYRAHGDLAGWIILAASTGAMVSLLPFFIKERRYAQYRRPAVTPQTESQAAGRELVRTTGQQYPC